MNRKLLACYPDGTCVEVDNDYESIKLAMEGATIDLVQLEDEHGFFIDDNGMLERAVLNVPASIFAQMALFGTVVLCGPPDEEGNTKPPHERVRKAFATLGGIWQRVCMDALRKGQRILVEADERTVPPAQVISLSDEQFAEYLRTGAIPDA